jgi:hypothetical protein
MPPIARALTDDFAAARSQAITSGFGVDEADTSVSSSPLAMAEVIAPAISASSISPGLIARVTCEAGPVSACALALAASVTFFRAAAPVMTLLTAP